MLTLLAEPGLVSSRGDRKVYARPVRQRFAARVIVRCLPWPWPWCHTRTCRKVPNTD